MAEYSMLLVNQSTRPGFFCVFQEYNGQIANVVSLAWQVAPATPGVSQLLTWNIDYGANFSKAKNLEPGTVLTQSQTFGLDPQKGNRSCVLRRDKYGYHFEQADAGESSQIEKGHMGIFTDNSILNEDVAIGLSMANKSMYATMATPNYTYDFEVTPNYKVIFVDTIQIGQILTVTQMTTMVAEVIYDDGRFSKTVVLDKQNNWHVENTDNLCARLLSHANEPSLETEI